MMMMIFVDHDDGDFDDDDERDIAFKSQELLTFYMLIIVFMISRQTLFGRGPSGASRGTTHFR